MLKLSDELQYVQVVDEDAAADSHKGDTVILGGCGHALPKLSALVADWGLAGFYWCAGSGSVGRGVDERRGSRCGDVERGGCGAGGRNWNSYVGSRPRLWSGVIAVAVSRRVALLRPCVSVLPDQVSAVRIGAAVISNGGGRTSHAVSGHSAAPSRTRPMIPPPPSRRGRFERSIRGGAAVSASTPTSSSTTCRRHCRRRGVAHDHDA